MCAYELEICPPMSDHILCNIIINIGALFFFTDPT